MRGPHNIIRLIRTGATLERTGAMKIILDAMEAGPVFRIVARTLVWPFQWLGYKGDVSMPPAPRALTALGPAYIKFGQVLSTRPDVVGDELAVQMRVLQDKLPPFSMKEAQAEVLRELGQSTDTLFSSFSEPVAAASLAQVHKAHVAETGEAVAVKILRPGIERAFRRDIDAFYFAARAIELLSPSSRHHTFRRCRFGRARLALGKLCSSGVCGKHAKRRWLCRAHRSLAPFRSARHDPRLGRRHEYWRQ